MGKKKTTRSQPPVNVTINSLPAAVQTTPTPKVKNGFESMVRGLSSMGGGGFGFGGGFPMNQGSPYSEQLSQSTSMFINLRWYLISNFRQMLSEAYAELGLVQTICKVPVDDALRGGIEIQCPELSEDEIKKLMTRMDREGDLTTTNLAGVWNRLFGGSAILILTDQDPEKPLRLSDIDEDAELEFRAVDMWELFFDSQAAEGFDPEMQTPDVEYYNYYGEQIHCSRVLLLKGITAPSFIRPRLRGWGVSVVETLVRSINQYLKATDLTFEVLDEFKLDVFQFENLAATMLSPNGEEVIQKRISLTNWLKNFQKALVLDKNDVYDNKQLSFTGVADIMTQIRMQVAADMRIPMTKLFGISATGFNSGEDDIEVYNALIESDVREKLKFPIARLVELRCQELFGFVPESLEIGFKPLRVLGAVDEENVKTQKFARLLQARQAGELTSIEFREGVNRNNLLEIQLDPTLGDLQGGDDADQADTDDEDESPDGGAANRPDSQKSKVPKPKKGGSGKPPKGQAPGVPEIKRSNMKNGSGVLIFMPQKYSRRQRLMRAIYNSTQYDIAAYEAEGGDGWIDPRRRPLFENPGNVDEGLWQRAKEASRKAFGIIKWQFVVFMYKKFGGSFI